MIDALPQAHQRHLQSRHGRMARHGRGQQWYAGLREAVRRCRDDDDTRHVAYEDFDAAGRALVDQGVERILTAMEDSAFVPKWARLELHKAFVISYDAEASLVARGAC